MRVYHVVCDRPVSLGQVICLDESNHTGVYTRVMTLADKAADVLARPEQYTAELEYPLMVALRELALEEVRREKFPEYPSRMACLYASSDEEPAVRWADYFVRLGRPTYAVANRYMAERYWRNEPNDEGKEPIREMLVDGDIRVVRIVREYGANIPT